jgi:uncharacterized protein (UPF0332 family)
MDNKAKDLSIYRMQNAVDTLDTARLCLDNKRYKDSINRCYYAAFYAVKAVLALEEKDFKRHKDAVAYFNQTYVATEIFPRETGKRLGRLKRKRETSDYDDFYVASYDEAHEQYESAEFIVLTIQAYLKERNISLN